MFYIFIRFTQVLLYFYSIQKQSTEVFFRKVYLKIRKVYKKAPVPESLF